MLGGGVHMRLDARDLGLQCLDARLQLLDRYRVEVLAPERDERIVRLAREKVVQIHGANR